MSHRSFKNKGYGSELIGSKACCKIWFHCCASGSKSTASFNVVWYNCRKNLTPRLLLGGEGSDSAFRVQLITAFQNMWKLITKATEVEKKNISKHITMVKITFRNIFFIFFCEIKLRSSFLIQKVTLRVGFFTISAIDKKNHTNQFFWQPKCAILTTPLKCGSHKKILWNIQ